MKQDKFADTFKLMIRELQTIIAVAYLMAVGIGMLFTYKKFSSFGINIFDYADLFDFLIAPFGDVTIMVFTCASLLLGFVLLHLDLWFSHRFPSAYSTFSFGQDKKPWFNGFRYFGFFVLSLFYLYISADSYGEYTEEKIVSGPSVNLEFLDGESVRGKMIGKTNEIMFVLTGQSLLAIPITALVKQIELSKRGLPSPINVPDIESGPQEPQAPVSAPNANGESDAEGSAGR